MKKRDYNILVNPWNSVSPFYQPNDLVTVENQFKYLIIPVKISEVAYESFQKLQYLADKKLGIEIFINSGYRSYLEQKALWEYKKARHGIEFVEKKVAKPGNSEHQTGLGIDIGKKVDGNETNPTPREYEEIRKLAKQCSLILRYPDNPKHPGEKHEKTGYIYEPWHFRYLEQELVTELFDTNITLEEYYEKTNNSRQKKYNFPSVTEEQGSYQYTKKM